MESIKDMDNLSLEDLIPGIAEPILAPVEKEKYKYNNILFGISFTFEILKEHKEYYEILINDEKKDILYKDYDLVDLINTGTMEKIQEE
jgi:hypothetical protein